MDAHAPFDAAIKGVLFVERKVVAGVGAQEDDRLLQGALRLVFENHGFRPANQRRASQVGNDLPRQFIRRCHNVRQPRVHRAARHRVKFGRGRFLDQHHARLLFDGAQAERAVGTHPRKNHPDAVFLLVLRQGTEKEINRQAQPAWRRRLEQVQHPVQDGHVLVRRDRIDAVRSHRRAILDLDDLHAGRALEQFGQHALLGRIQMLDDVTNAMPPARRHVTPKNCSRASELPTRPRRRCATMGNEGFRRRHGGFRAGNFGRIFPPARR